MKQEFVEPKEQRPVEKSGLGFSEPGFLRRNIKRLGDFLQYKKYNFQDDDDQRELANRRKRWPKPEAASPGSVEQQDDEKRHAYDGRRVNGVEIFDVHHDEEHQSACWSQCSRSEGGAG